MRTWGVALALTFVSLALCSAQERYSVQPLARVEYTSAGQKRSAVAEIVLSGEETLKLRLFNQRIGAYYTIHVAHTELVSVKYLSRGEAGRVDAARREAIRTVKERRDARRKRLAKTRGRTRQDAPRRRRGKARDPRGRLLRELRSEITTAIDELERIRRIHIENVQAVGEKQRTTESRRLHVGIRELAEEVEQIDRGLKHRSRQLGTLEQDQELSIRDLEQQRDSVRRLLGRLERRLEVAARDVATHTRQLAGLPGRDGATSQEAAKLHPKVLRKKD